MMAKGHPRKLGLAAEQMSWASDISGSLCTPTSSYLLQSNQTYEIHYTTSREVSLHSYLLILKLNTHFHYSRFATGRSDLETVSSVLAVHCHDRTIIQVLNQAPSHFTSVLTHQVSTLCEEIQPLPSCGDQACFTERFKNRDFTSEMYSKQTALG